MVEGITSSSVYNSFAVFREILTGITALSTLNAKFGIDKNYYEDMPKFKAVGYSSVDFPFSLVETDVDAIQLTLKDKRTFPMTTTVTIFTDYSIEKEKNLLNSYINVITNYFYANRDTLRNTYGLVSLEISKDRSTDVILNKRLVLGVLTFNYHVTLNTSS